MSQDAPLRDRARTLERILTAADELLYARAARELKVRDIAARAGVSPSLVVQYFESKDALVLEIGLRRLGGPMPLLAPDADLGAVIGWMLDHDIENIANLRDLMRQSWWWTEATERAFEDAAQPRIAALSRALGGEAYAPLALTIYLAAVRRGLALNQPREAIGDAARTATAQLACVREQARN